MDNSLIKMVILQEKLNELCMSINSEDTSYVNLIDKFKSSIIFGEDLMDILFASYYVKNVKSQDFVVLGLVNLISNYANNKEVLHNFFLNNSGIANALVISYLNDYKTNTRTYDFIDKCDSKEKNIAFTLSPIFNYKGFNFLSLLSRYTLFKISCKCINEMKDYQSDSDIYLIDDEKILSRILIGDAYTYMNLNNDGLEFTNYIKMIEENASNFQKIEDYLNNNLDCTRSFILYSSNLFLGAEPYSDMYMEAKSLNPKYFDTLKKVNPFYILDSIEDFNVKKYEKYRK